MISFDLTKTDGIVDSSDADRVADAVSAMKVVVVSVAMLVLCGVSVVAFWFALVAK